MPQAIAYPEPELYPVAQEQQSVQPASYVTTQDTATISTADETPAPMSMPLPALNEVANVPEASRFVCRATLYARLAEVHVLESYVRPLHTVWHRVAVSQTSLRTRQSVSHYIQLLI